MMKNAIVFLVTGLCLMGSMSCMSRKIDYRSEMTNLVSEIKIHAKAKDEDFLIIPQNALELVFEDVEKKDVNLAYLEDIDAIGIESLNYGYFYKDGVVTPKAEKMRMASMLDIFKRYKKKVLSIDYVMNQSQIQEVIYENRRRGYISFPSLSRDLDGLIKIYDENDRDVTDIKQARNFLYIINPQNYGSKDAFLDELSNTNWDVVIVDAFFGEEALSFEDVQSLKVKKNGGKRLVISYLSIGEAENYRYYWKDEWNQSLPVWIDEENPIWRGNYKVRYWSLQWKKILIYANDSYLNRILEAGFDGAYLDLVDSFYYFEEKYQKKQ